MEANMQKGTKFSILIIAMLVIVTLLPGSVMAKAIVGSGVTLYVPDSYFSCKPADTISTEGVPTGGKIIFDFFQIEGTSLVRIGGGTAFGDIAVDFPYPTLGTGTYSFAVFTAIFDVDGNILTKLNGKWTITCEKETPPPGFEGCTPGFWRQPQHYDSWTSPYAPSMLFVVAFGEDAFPDKTLGEVVRLGGGSLNALGRHSVAALLNAASPDVDYAYSVSQVIQMFQNVYPDGNFEAVKDVFEFNNELGCPLN
jgi:hypothetical protein